jgi:hypothetical protein
VIPPSGPTTTVRSPSGRHVHSGQSRRGLLVEHERHPAARVHCGRQWGDHRQPRTARLLGRLPGGRPPPLQRPVTALAPPLRHRAGRVPGHDLVHAGLGHRLYGQLAPVPLGDRLNDDQPGHWGGDKTPGHHGQVQEAPPRGEHLRAGRTAPPVAEQQPLAGPQPHHVGRVMPLRAVEPESLPGRQRVDEEEREAHGPPPAPSI